MSGRPIPFTGAMVRAWLEGRKTQTRRILGDQPGDLDRPFMMDDGSWHTCDSQGGHMSPLGVKYRKGDRLWVRENWRTEPAHDHLKPSEVPLGAPLLHMAGTGVSFPSPLWGRLRVGRYMMRWMSRLTLTLTEVRVQRLQDIDMDDAADEGLRYIDEGAGAGFWVVDGTPVCSDGTVEAYAQLWEHINGDGTWKANPWVTALTAEMTLRNIDE